jgi:hypothetical protein
MNIQKMIALTIACTSISVLNSLATITMTIAMARHVPFPFGEHFWSPLVGWGFLNFGIAGLIYRKVAAHG